MIVQIAGLVAYQEADNTRGTDRRLVDEGDTVTSFRGETATFLRATRARITGKSGKVMVRWLDGNAAGTEGEYYDGVFGLTVEGILTCGCPLRVVADEGHQEGCAERATVQ